MAISKTLQIDNSNFMAWAGVGVLEPGSIAHSEVQLCWLKKCIDLNFSCQRWQDADLHYLHFEWAEQMGAHAFKRH